MIQDLRYRCRQCKRQLSKDEVVMEVRTFAMGDGKKRTLTITWCRSHTPDDIVEVTA